MYQIRYSRKCSHHRNATVAKNIKNFETDIYIPDILNFVGKCYFPNDFVYRVWNFEDSVDAY